jgi:hypothetical protein
MITKTGSECCVFTAQSYISVSRLHITHWDLYCKINVQTRKIQVSLTRFIYSVNVLQSEFKVMELLCKAVSLYTHCATRTVPTKP